MASRGPPVPEWAVNHPFPTMLNAIARIQQEADAEQDASLKAELLRAVDALKRMETATSHEERPNMLDPNYKQVANAPDDGKTELANEKARRNREVGPLPETIRPPESGTKTPPPAEKGPEPRKVTTEKTEKK